jgi:hypothetical protein
MTHSKSKTKMGIKEIIGSHIVHSTKNYKNSKLDFRAYFVNTQYPWCTELTLCDRWHR